MTINKLKELGLIKSDTPLTSFKWQDDNNVYVDID